MRRIFANATTLESAQTDPRRTRLLNLAEHIFEPLNKLFLRHSILVPELERILRWKAMRTAFDDPEFAVDGRSAGYQQTFSHAAVITGLSRQEVAQAVQLETAPVDPTGGDLHRVIRILTAWRTDPGYQDDEGHPIDLNLRGGSPSFHQLCLKYGRDTPTRPIADALVKNGNAEWVKGCDGNGRGKKLRYLHPVVTADLNTSADIEILTQIASDFMHTLQQAFDAKVQSQPRLREGYFNNIDREKADEAIAFLHDEIQKFNVRCSEGLKKYRARPGTRGIRIGVGSYSFSEAPRLLDEPDY